MIGRYCNYKSNQLMGVNLTAPVVQLQVPFAMLMAVVMLHEKFTVLQAIGAALIINCADRRSAGDRSAPARSTKRCPTANLPWLAYA